VRRSKIPRGLSLIGLYLCLGLQLLMGAWPASGMLLCRAEDGHVAIEVGHGESPCLGDYHRHHPRDPAPRDFEHHRCTDTALVSPAVSSASMRTFVSTDFRSHPLAILLSTVPAAPRDTSPIPHIFTKSSSSSARSLCTIVLLI